MPRPVGFDVVQKGANTEEIRREIIEIFNDKYRCCRGRECKFYGVRVEPPGGPWSYGNPQSR